MIRSECIIKLEEIEHIGIVCKKCKTEMRLALGYDFGGTCPCCSSRINPQYINELLNLFSTLQTVEGIRNQLPDIVFITSRREKDER